VASIMDFLLAFLARALRSLKVARAVAVLGYLGQVLPPTQRRQDIAVLLGEGQNLNFLVVHVYVRHSCSFYLIPERGPIPQLVAFQRALVAMTSIYPK
jgi:hypothetical protein